MDDVGDPEQEVSAGVLDRVGLGVEPLLVLAELAAVDLNLGGLVDAAFAPQAADLLREIVDLGSHLITLSGQVPQSLVERDRLVELGEHGGVAAAGERGTHAVRVGAQQPNVDHGFGNLPAQPLTGRVGSSAGGVAENSRSTSA